MKKYLSILILLSFIIQLSSEEKITEKYWLNRPEIYPNYELSETYPDYELVEKAPIEIAPNEKLLRKNKNYHIKYEEKNIRTLYDESTNKILSLKPDVYKFEDIANVAVSENGITIFDSYEKRFTPEYKTMIKWIDKKGNVINTYDLKKNQRINPYYLADKNSWLIFTDFNDYYESYPSDLTINYGGILVFDEYGNKALEINIPSEYDDFKGYTTYRTGELIVASFYDLNFKSSNSNPRHPHTIVFNINGGFSQVLQQISHRGVFSEDNKLFHSLRTLVDVTSGEVIFKSQFAYHAFPASKDSGIIAYIRNSEFRIMDYRNKKILLFTYDKSKATIYSVSPDASEIIIHQKGYAYKYQRKKL